jgi:glycerate kinase
VPKIRVLIAPSGFKEGLSAEEAAAAMAGGVKAAAPDALVHLAPVPDGGEGFTRTLVSLTQGALRRVTVTGPLGDPVEAEIGCLGGAHEGTAVIEIAAAAGLKLVPKDRRDPLRTTSRGVGELIRAALDLAPKHIIVGCGDSGVNDGGCGMAAALGVGLFDRNDRALCAGGGAMINLARIDPASRDPRIAEVTFEAAVNIRNDLLGKYGVSRVYGPQKGASPQAIPKLERGMQVFAEVVRRDLGVDCGAMAGAGASGGLGAGLAAFCGATLRPRMQVAMRFAPLDAHLSEADLVLTAEGMLDAQSSVGKVPGEIGALAERHGVPVFAIGGGVAEGAEALHLCGVSAIFALPRGAEPLEEAIRETPERLAHATEQAVRAFLAGRARQGR